MKDNYVDNFAVTNELEKVRQEFKKYDKEFGPMIMTYGCSPYLKVIQLNECYGAIMTEQMVKCVARHGIIFDFVKGPGYPSNKTAYKLGEFIMSLDRYLGDLMIRSKDPDDIKQHYQGENQYLSIPERTTCLVYTKNREWVDLYSWVASFDTAVQFYFISKNGLTLSPFAKLTDENALEYAQTMAALMSNKGITVIARKRTVQDDQNAYENEILRRQALKEANMQLRISKRKAFKDDK